MEPDDWDTVTLSQTSGDGLHIANIQMVHSNELVLDSAVNAWLDRYYATVLDFTLDTGLTRFDQTGGSRVTALYYASQELGQTGSEKYYSGDIAWCSEFTAWALRKAGLSTPTGSIGVSDMDSYFTSRSRYYSKSDVEAGLYEPKAGDYVAVNGRQHSVLFVEWVSKAGTYPANGDTYMTIEGNTCNSVQIKTRSWSSVDFVGRAQ